MPRDWKEISDDEILNYQDATTGVVNRYQRIMEMKTIEALGGVKDKLMGVMETVYRASQSLAGQTDKLIDRYDKISKAQGRQQVLLILLSAVIAGSTVAYTWITWQSVTAIREANQVQKQLLELEIQKAKAQARNG